MNPEEYNLPSATSDPDAGFKKKLRLLAALVVVAVIVFIVLAYLSSHRAPAFAITRTDPTIANVNTQTPSLAVEFNDPLAANSASVTSTPSIITGTSISGDTLTLTLAPKTMLSTKTYFVTIKSISSTNGKHLTNQQLTINPKLAAPIFYGEDALTNIGLTTAQLNDINLYTSQFSPWAQKVTVDPTTIKHYMVNPNDAWSPWAVGFTASIDGTSYNFVGSFYDAQDIQLNINDATTGQQVYSAGAPGQV